nr:UTRA domain-containing protein [Flexivirga endophytica]
MWQALLTLANKGYLRRTRGRGSFVTERRPNFSVVPFPLPGRACHHDEVLGIELVEIDVDAARSMGLPDTTRLVRIDRLRYEGDASMALERTYRTGEVYAIGDMDIPGNLIDLCGDGYGIRADECRVPVQCDVSEHR